MAAASSFSSILLLFLISLLSTAFLSSIHGFTDDPLIQQVVSSDGRGGDLLMRAEHQFTVFKKEYGKTYPTQEEDDYRFGVFISNLRLARRNQIMDPTAVHGVTQFSDLTPSEFRRRFLGSGRRDDQILQLSKDISKAPILPTDKLPRSRNWTARGAVTAVKNQGDCDGCWAFSSIAVLEGAHFLANRKLVNLSEQQLIDCSKDCSPQVPNLCDLGCKGGHRLLAYKYIKNAGGVAKAEDYRFTGTENGFCNVTDNSQMVASISNYEYIGPDEAQYAAYLVKRGPLTVNINIKTIQTYKKGVLCPRINCSSYVDNSTSASTDEIFNHAVVLVGYRNRTRYSDDHDHDNNHRRKKFWWMVKNSWGSKWGELGYFRVCGGLLTACEKNPIAIYVVAEKKLSSLARLSS
ncbi:hypothetical protein LWI28_013226 [Acer negundo]|uniref:Uncharacterized protein n=1 Tax=Acer negundo TaxID=4023 RepID=A0AAD5P743_ACENE|nr:hypothetical protein LWI28_013226 [Acer negundo]